MPQRKKSKDKSATNKVSDVPSPQASQADEKPNGNNGKSSEYIKGMIDDC